LRGCIGNIEPTTPLWDAIADNAVSAAIHDVRFAAVTKDELKNLTIEISILTPPQQCSLDEIKPGEDGVVISQAGRKATYLPQVWEQISDRDQFFSSLCEKAGLPSDCYKNSQIKFYKYQANAFHE
jgi:AmmeMemoRadiSam system protein A